MILTDGIELENLLQDEHSGKIYGRDRQLTVVGYFVNNSENRYVVKCINCSKDPELYGNGLFESKIGNLNSGRIPCACSRMYTHTEEQYEILYRRKATEIGLIFKEVRDFGKGVKHIVLVCKEHGELIRKAYASFLKKGHSCKYCKMERTRSLSEDQDFKTARNLCESSGYIFMGWFEEYKGKDSFCRISCNTHGEWTTTSFLSLKYNKTGCPQCARERIGNSCKKDDEHFLHKINEAFKDNPISCERVDSYYWKCECIKCGCAKTDHISNFVAGKFACDCGYLKNQRYAYISIIKDGEDFKALKFGISKNVNRRLKEQDLSCIYSVTNYGVWEFPDREKLLNAEKNCKQLLETSVLTEMELKDGYSETTYVKNLETIVEIYEYFGGIRIEQ